MIIVAERPKGDGSRLDHNSPVRVVAYAAALFYMQRKELSRLYVLLGFLVVGGIALYLWIMANAENWVAALTARFAPEDEPVVPKEERAVTHSSGVAQRMQPVASSGPWMSPVWVDDNDRVLAADAFAGVAIAMQQMAELADN